MSTLCADEREAHPVGVVSFRSAAGASSSRASAWSHSRRSPASARTDPDHNHTQTHTTKRAFFDPCHYNLLTSEICHYNSPILKSAITIFRFFESCHFIRLWCHWTHLQNPVFLYGPKYPCCFSPNTHWRVGPTRQLLLQPSVLLLPSTSTS